MIAERFSPAKRDATMPIVEDEPKAQQMDEESSACSATNPNWLAWLWGHTWRVIIFITGMALLVVGAIGFAIPVLPGWPFLLAGLAVLATEFAWAKWILHEARKRATQVVTAVKTSVAEKAD
jgi:hypothetical protein